MSEEMQTEENVAQPPTLTLTLSLEEVNLALSGLAELPAKISMGLIEKIRLQGMQQLNELNKSSSPAAE